ncbi:MAG: hypothetical protein E7390_07115 [Ruminococcaceae bacterium]|nr:hypothetical protein [Oscillospiraceae bacterium]
MKNAKKLMGLVLTVVMLASLAVVPTVRAEEGETATETERFANGGFEPEEGTEVTSTTWFENWNYTADASGNTYSYNNTVLGTDVFLTGSEKHSGSYALAAKFSGGTEHRRIWTQVQGLEAGKWYQASAWVKISGTEITASSTPKSEWKGVELRVSTNASASGSIAESTALGRTSASSAYNYMISTKGKWARIGVNFMAKTSNKVSLILQMGNGAEGAVAYWDDIAVTELTDFNGDFETTEGAGLLGWNSGYSDNNALVGYEAVAVQEDGCGGTAALKLVGDSETGDVKRVYTVLTGLEAGKRYGIRIRHKATSTRMTEGDEPTAATAIGSNPKMHVVDNKETPADSTAWLCISNMSKAVNTWKTSEGTFLVPAVEEGEDTTAHTFITLSCKLLAGEAVFFDDIEVFETNVKYYNSDNEELKNVTAGTIKAVAEFVNPKAEATDATLVVAVYKSVNGAKQLKSIDIKVMEDVAAKAVGKVTGTVTAEAGDTVKAMLLDSTAALTPITSPFILE